MTKAAQNETFHRLTIAAMIGSLENLDKISSRRRPMPAPAKSNLMCCWAPGFIPTCSA